MKKAVGNLLVATALAAAPITSAKPQSAPRGEEVARATWVTDTKGVRTRYEILGRKAADPTGNTLTTGAIATRSCLNAKKKRARVCLASINVQRLDHDDFEVDPTLSNASLEMKFAGKPQIATWDAASGVPMPSLEEALAGNPSVERSAEAEGEAFRESLDQEDLKEALLQKGAESRKIPGLPPAPYPELPGFGSRSSVGSSSTCWDSKRAERRFARKMNRVRTSRNRGRLRFDPELSKAARVHTREMVSRVFLHHTSEDSLRQRVTNWMMLGENVGVGATVASLHSAFMNSPAHKDNILFSKFNHVGVGTASGGGRLWVTVIFESKENPGTRLRMRC